MSVNFFRSANLLLVPVLLPLAVGLFTFILPKKDRWFRGILALLATAAAFAAAILIYFAKVPEFRYALLELGRFNLNFDLVPTPLSLFILIFATGFGFFITLYSLAYMADKVRHREYYAFFLFAVGGASGVLLADHFIIFLIFCSTFPFSSSILYSKSFHQGRLQSCCKSFRRVFLSNLCKKELLI